MPALTSCACGRLLGSRRFGKTDGSIGPRIYRVSQSMPRATNIWLGNSRKQLYTRTVPGTIAAIERFFGIRESVHFGWGKPDPYKRVKVEQGGISSDTGAASGDDRQTSLEFHLNGVLYDNLYVTPPQTGGWDGLMVASS